jgi:hypothetical protein
MLLNFQKAPMAIPGNLQQIPIVVNRRQLDNRLINVAPLPLFTKQQNSDHDSNLGQFMVAYIANNVRIDEHWKMIFPTTLKDLTFQWYDCQAHGTFPKLDKFKGWISCPIRPLSFFDRLCEQLTQIQTILRKSITFYVIRMEDILRRWNNHSRTNHM